MSAAVHIGVAFVLFIAAGFAVTRLAVLLTPSGTLSSRKQWDPLAGGDSSINDVPSASSEGACHD